MIRRFLPTGGKPESGSDEPWHGIIYKYDLETNCVFWVELVRYVHMAYHNIANICCLQDLVKKCDEGVADHREYDGALAVVREWLLSMESELALVSDTTGDKDAAQAKLAKLQVNTPHLLQKGIQRVLQTLFHN